jgi:diacylglycerol kinase (ATP)
MHEKNGLSLLFVINPVSGGKEKQDWEASIRNYFKESIHLIEFYILSKKNDSESIRHYIETIRPDKVVAVGGDGTIKMVAELIRGTKTQLGILPAGSANGMAKELNIPIEIKPALDVITGTTVKAIDLLQINNHICIHLSDIGMNAMLLKYFEHANVRGMWGYTLALFRVLWSKQKHSVTIKASGKTIQRKAYMVVIANAATYGTGAVINPRGNLYDGIFEIVVIRKLKLLELFKMLLSHTPFNPDSVELISTDMLDLSTIRKAHFQVDGEYLGRVTRVEAKILHQAIYVCLPGEV